MIFNLIATIAIDLTKFLHDVQNSINLDDAKFILIDRSKYIFFDCDNLKCYVDYEKYVLNLSDLKEEFEKEQCNFQIQFCLLGHENRI